ncbi:hypothetical protein SD70_30770 [Gordoniibacillus kamchatkensis]|uniref:EXPERA domain-containing protein n=1 Tax=Gordoniibacillus kamchatkensis TaxID=1590651 RepID=A0ABR5A9Q0_9BACL|nr:hypothetical protein [Paenibacillus sp. VKM B-2647]KIL37784.1 hypothetical protein SD70_30770 [Paenibacillus sp. VKM B-2647]
MVRFPEVNVWFSTFFFAAGWVLVALLPLRLPRSVSALVMMLSLALPLGMDHTIGVPPVDMYDTNVNPKLTFSELPTWGMYPVFGYLFIYLYDKWNIKGPAIALYVFGWAIVGTAFEALAVAFHVFRYKGWSLRYSYLVYVLVQLLTVAVFRLLMHVFVRTKKANP